MLRRDRASLRLGVAPLLRRNVLLPQFPISPLCSSRKSYVTGRQGQPHPSTHPHLLKTGEITPGTSKEEYEERRNRFLHSLPPGSVALIPSAPERFMSNDIPYVFHQNTNFLYLSGYNEPDALLVLQKGPKEKCYMTMFVRPKDPDREIWDGPRSGVEGALEIFGANEAYSLKELESKIGPIIAGAPYIFIETGVHPTLFRQISSSITNPATISSPKSVLDQMRVKKSASEIAIMRKSTEISGLAFKEIMKATAPGMIENQLEAHFEFEIKKRGAQRIAYPPVFASGINANTLHYVANDSIMKEGDVVLVDAGGEYNNFVSDITRTWPVSGRFTRAQKEVYEAVLFIQEQVIKRCKEGTSIDALHVASVELARKALRGLGVPRASDNYYKYYPHSIGHWVGMDVHDVGSVSTATKLEPGMMCTVEPGIYIPNDSSVPEEYLTLADPLGFQLDLIALSSKRFRGIGVRIEDDILITPAAPEVLTKSAPKQVAEIEELMSTAQLK